MKSGVIGSAAIVAGALLLAQASAQEGTKAGTAAGGAATNGAAGAEGSQRMLPQGGSAQGAGEASPGMKPAAGAAPAPGQRQEGENVGVSPAQQPSPPAEPSKQRKEIRDQDKPAKKGGAEEKPGKTGAEAQPGKQQTGQENGAAKPAGEARPTPKITNVQETKIQQTIKTVKVAPVRVDFHVGVGVAVPRTVVLNPLPPTIITIVPDYEGFRFFLVPGEIVIVDPVTLEIVAVLPL